MYFDAFWAARVCRHAVRRGPRVLSSSNLDAAHSAFCRHVFRRVSLSPSQELEGSPRTGPEVTVDLGRVNRPWPVVKFATRPRAGWVQPSCCIRALRRGPGSVVMLHTCISTRPSFVLSSVVRRGRPACSRSVVMNVDAFACGYHVKCSGRVAFRPGGVQPSSLRRGPPAVWVLSSWCLRAFRRGPGWFCRQVLRRGHTAFGYSRQVACVHFDAALCGSAVMSFDAATQQVGYCRQGCTRAFRRGPGSVVMVPTCISTRPLRPVVKFFDAVALLAHALSSWARRGRCAPRVCNGNTHTPTCRMDPKIKSTDSRFGLC